jgi:hypothetical protein
MTHLKIRKAQSFMLILIVTVIAYASVFGPEARYTSAPGDLGNCTVCHDDRQVNSGPGSVTLTNIPQVYTPGQQYTLTVTVQQSGRSKFGFQLTAIDVDGNRAGTLAALGNDSQINPVTGTKGRQYIQHTSQGTNSTSSGRRVWQIRWTAPSTDVGTVRFFFSGNATNNDGTNRNDFIYTNFALTESPTTNVTLDLLTNPAGETLQAGSQFLVDWSATGLVNVDSYELRYSLDDGETFPISNLIFSTQDENVTEFNWTVPDKSSTKVRLRLQAATKSGSAVEIRTDKFVIQGSGALDLPTVTGAQITGKKLTVTGSNFSAKAQVYVNGVKQKTKNVASSPSSQLLCKKGGVDIAVGQTVMLKVINKDGTESEEVPFTRP